MFAIGTLLCSLSNNKCVQPGVYAARMYSKATVALRDNVKRLMEDRGMSQRELAKEAGLSQSAVGYLLRYSDEHDRHPSTSTVEAIAEVFGLGAWQLMLPDLPMDLVASNRFARLIENYRDAPAEGRAQVERIAESEVKYAVAESVLIGNKQTGTGSH